MKLQPLENKEISTQKLENELLQMPQEDCPVEHFFSEGVYVRQVTLKKGLFVLGHKHKTSHLNIMVQGCLLLLNENGSVSEIKAPFMKQTKAGRKVAFILEDVVWLNIYATHETNIETLENMFLDKSFDFKMYEEKKFQFDYAFKQEDRDDFNKLLKEYNFSEEEINHKLNEVDSICMFPSNWKSFISIRRSPIHGKGFFASKPYKKNDIILPAIINGKRTAVLKFINHSKNPNCSFQIINKNDIYLKSNRHIQGCVGGDHGEEMTVNYREFLELQCQQ